jgi:cell division control protein 24
VSERKYVQDIEILHDLKLTLIEKDLISNDLIYQIFLNIDAILELQRRFLIRIETANSLPNMALQRLGQLFRFWENAFTVYEPFIANQRKAAQVARMSFDNIQQSKHPIVRDFALLHGFLLGPMERFKKYPLLLKDLIKICKDAESRENVNAGYNAAQRILEKLRNAEAGIFIDEDFLKEALTKLTTRVKNWKSLEVKTFGTLLLYGTYSITVGKSDEEKDVSTNSVLGRREPTHLNRFLNGPYAVRDLSF